MFGVLLQVAAAMKAGLAVTVGDGGPGWAGLAGWARRREQWRPGDEARHNRVATVALMASTPCPGHEG
jgi:hypothetical protein